jgi:hypothetical protein
MLPPAAVNLATQEGSREPIEITGVRNRREAYR